MKNRYSISSQGIQSLILETRQKKMLNKETCNGNIKMCIKWKHRQDFICLSIDQSQWSLNVVDPVLQLQVIFFIFFVFCLNFWKKSSLKEINQFTIYNDPLSITGSMLGGVILRLLQTVPSSHDIGDQWQGLPTENTGTLYSPKFRLEDPWSDHCGL